MANKPTPMYKLRLLLKHYHAGASKRWMADVLDISRSTLNVYLARIESLNLAFEEWEALSDLEVSRLLINPMPAAPADPRLAVLTAMLPQIAKDLKKKGMTIMRQWKLYYAKHPNGYRRTGFFKHVNHYLERHTGHMVVPHKYGDHLFVDYAGRTLPYADTETGELIECQVFVAILPASQYVYVEAQPSQKQEYFIEGIRNALRYIGGVPQAIVPDNLKSAVIKAHRYEPTINPALASFAEHYTTVIMPTRVRRPRDKALVEGMVSIIYQEIYHDVNLLNATSLEQLNLLIWERLEVLNEAPRTQAVSRSEEFLEHERETLMPLPASDWEPITVKNVKVQRNGHVTLRDDQHHYSVPYTLIGKVVELVFSHSRVRLYYNQELIAEHSRNLHRGKYTTDLEHLASHHRVLLERSPQHYLDKAAEVGPFTRILFERILSKASYPEQGYKTCDGILSLGKRFGIRELELSATYAQQLDMVNYHIIHRALTEKHYLDQVGESASIVHRHVRGGSYYAQINKTTNPVINPNTFESHE